MSVEKMNAYKEQKSHRKENLAREKRRKKTERVVWYAVGAAVLVAICAAIGLTGWNSYKRYQDSLPNYDVTSQVISDFSGVLDVDEEADADIDEAGEAGAEEAGEEPAEAVTEAAAETAAAETAAEEAETAAAETQAE